jgi:outer membrane lipopolysaccharide assembly protein LptE/RlpB
MNSNSPLIRRLLHWLPLALALTGLTGLTACKSYQLGHPAELPFETLYVAPAANESYAPQAQALVSTAVRNAIIRDGRVRLIAQPEEADAILKLTLSDYQRATGTRDPQDTSLAQDYDLILNVQIDLYDQRSKAYLIESKTLTDATVAYLRNPYTGQSDGLTQAESQAMPRLARDLARKIADEVLSAW